MSNAEVDTGFIGALPQRYQTHLVPLIFEPYAADLVHRLAARPVSRVLEIAAGTGVVTRRLVSVLPEGVSIVASDLNQAMLDQAVAVGTTRPVEWRQADAMRLPFQDGAFDAVVCCRPASLPRSHPIRLLRSADHRARSFRRRVYRVTRVHHRSGAQSGEHRPDPCDRVLSGNTATKRDRGAGCRGARRSNRPGCRGHRSAVWRGRGDGKIQAHVVGIEK